MCRSAPERKHTTRALHFFFISESAEKSLCTPSCLRPDSCSHISSSIRPQHEDSKSGHHRSHSRAESQVAAVQRTQSHSGGHSQNSKGPYTPAHQGSSSQSYQEQNQDLRHLAAQPSTAGRSAASSPEWKDTYVPELCSGDRRRYDGRRETRFHDC